MPFTFKHILLGALFSASCLSVHALPVDHYADASKLSSGKWVKIKVSQTGMQQITYSQLRSWGFDNPARVSVYGFGGLKLSVNHTFDQSTPDDLKQTATLRTADKLIFYGQSDTNVFPLDGSNINFDRNIYDTAGYYFLSDCEAPQSINSVRYDKTQEAYLKANEHYHVEIVQPDDYNFCKGGAYWFGPKLSTTEAVDINLPVRQFVSSYSLNKNVYFGYTFGVRDFSYSNALNIEYPETMLNHTDRYANIPNSGLNLFTLSNGYATLAPKKTGDFENSSLSFKIRLGEGTTPQIAALKHAWLLYARRNELTAEIAQLPMSFVGFTQRQIFTVTGPKQAEVWNVSDPANVYRYETVYNSSTRKTMGTIDYTSARLAQSVAFIPTQQLIEPEYVGEVANQNIHGMETPEMVIVTNDELYAPACQLADIHRSRGRKVAVLRHSQILNEFSSGAQTPMAYRLMAKMFYDRDPQTFKYLLLYGPAAWDYRGIEQHVTYQPLLSFVADKFSHLQSFATNYTTDTYFGMLEDNYVHNDIENAKNSIAVGRLNITNPTQSYAVNDKIRRYIDNPLDPEVWYTTVLLADSQDDNRHMAQSETVGQTMLASQPAMTFNKYFRGFASPNLGQTRKLLERSLQSGCGVFDFAGHGNSMSFSRELTWRMSNVVNTEYDRFPIGIFATCESFTFDYGNYDMSSQMLCMPNGGTIASVGPSRKAYLIHNGPFNIAIANALAAAKPGETLGDAYRNGRENARAAMRTNNMGLTNAMSYHLCGDPMLPLPVPEFGVSVTKLGADDDRAEDQQLKLRPLDACPIEGVITRADGSVAEDFNGTARITVFDGASLYGSWQNVGEAMVTVMQDRNVLATFAAEVTNGRFATTMYIPAGNTTDLTNRMVISAVAPKSESQPKRGAIGVCNMLSMSATAPAVSNDTPAGAPAISAMYINSPSFANGQSFDANTALTLHVVASAPTGISSATNLPGAAPSVVVDATNSVSNALLHSTMRPDGAHEFSCSLPAGLSAGRHDLTFTVTNNLLERSSRTISFMITPATIHASLAVAEDPAVTEATISLTADAEYTGCSLIITDAQGNSVFTTRDCNFPYAWNLKAADGTTVPDGIYQASVILTSPNAHGTTAPTEIVVIKDL